MTFNGLMQGRFSGTISAIVTSIKIKVIVHEIE